MAGSVHVTQLTMVLVIGRQQRAAEPCGAYGSFESVRHTRAIFDTVRDTIRLAQLSARRNIGMLSFHTA